ncbi:histidine kinase [Streptomyces sp. NBC_01220]|uniref:histidine kinase n=1 Tax=Streptomyces poriferorum TaxID=2798799 RepID=A0ABY9ITW1_9ACTN|nr:MULTISPECIES: histidine kinase [Streptomyces]MBW5258471.1 two-component sensor histidine kinase [Streptomyces poriferorum]MDP5313012.1 histidine kinase [Streptomyces sp. Alt4]WLQ57986.1 histidine kinase [Streptomyces sp. Alt2]WSQ45390.1 histidine kinase [Streptomyces sp. NBC_01220]
MTQTKTRSPELRVAEEAIAGLRQDLVHDAFAYRPMGPMRTDGVLTRRLSEGLRARAEWTPHAVVLAAALLVFMIGFSITGNAGVLVSGLMPAACVGMTLVRPVGAFWMSMALMPVSMVAGSSDGPWVQSTFFAHLVVLVVVAARTKPRTAAWLWGLTVLFGTLLENVGGWNAGPSTPAMAVASAFALLLVCVVQIRREAEREVTVQRTVTAVERDRRTLLEERTTIARELHDVVAHHMSVVAIQAEAAPYRVENPPPELEQAFLTIRENAVAALTELRRVLGVVRAEDYEAPDAPQPTLAELDGLLANVGEAGLPTEKTVTGAVRELPQGVELSAYRIIQEALSNSLRHAPGATAKVEIGYVLGGLGLRVVNGPPTAPAKPSPGAGHGITGMRERVAMLNGEMTAETTAEGGYEVTAFIPVPAAPSDAPAETAGEQT